MTFCFWMLILMSSADASFGYYHIAAVKSAIASVIGVCLVIRRLRTGEWPE